VLVETDKNRLMGEDILWGNYKKKAAKSLILSHFQCSNSNVQVSLKREIFQKIHMRFEEFPFELKI